MSGRKPRSPSGSKFKINIAPAPSPAPPARTRSDITRTTKITKLENGERKEYVVSFDELESGPGDFLGRGQFGTVKKMYHKPSDLIFAVKMINDDLMSNESNDRRNSDIMDLEAPLKMGDACPFLIRFYGAMHADSYYWILTEVMDTSLDRFYAKLFALKLDMPESLVSKIAFSVLSALDHMRNLKLMHRDIKPSNILINATGEIKVCDFGISGFTTNSVCTTFKGCQRYMPPEKIDPSLSGNGYSIKADIWSLGISLIEIVTGVHPFEGKAFLGLIKSIVTDDPPTLSDKYSEEIRLFVNKCLKKIPDQRSNCSDLLEDTFIKKYLDYDGDKELIKRVVDEVKKDVIEP